MEREGSKVIACADSLGVLYCFDAQGNSTDQSTDKSTDKSTNKSTDLSGASATFNHPLTCHLLAPSPPSPPSHRPQGLIHKLLALEELFGLNKEIADKVVFVQVGFANSSDRFVVGEYIRSIHVVYSYDFLVLPSNS